MKIARSQHFSKCIILTRFCSFKTGYFFLLLKALSVRFVIELQFKVQLSPDYPTSTKNIVTTVELYVQARFENFTGLSMGIPITNCLPVFF